MLVRLDAEPCLHEFLLTDGSVLACFDREKLTSMHKDGIAWWDEVHKECILGVSLEMPTRSTIQRESTARRPSC